MQINKNIQIFLLKHVRNYKYFYNNGYNKSLHFIKCPALL